MKKKFPALREENRPVTQFLSKRVHWTQAIVKLIPQIATAETVKPEVAAKGVNQSKNLLFEKQLLDHIKRHQKRPEFTAIKNKLIPEIETLAKKGVKVVFFEMPTHPKLCSSELISTIRENMFTFCSEYGCDYFEAQNCESYTTTDGHHLDKESAERFTTLLISQLKTQGLL